MTSFRVLLIASAFIIPFAIALKCYTVGSTLLNATSTIGSENDCPVNTLTCLKSVDLVQKTFTKGCGSIGVNCTGPQGQPNYGATCNNNTFNLACCCYGDRCNSTSFTSVFIGLLMAILVILQNNN